MKNVKAVNLDRTENVGESHVERDFLRLASGATALALGTMLASLAALRHDASGYSFHAGLGTLLAFVIGAAAGFSYWQLIGRSESARSGSKLRWTASLLLLLMGIGGFLYPLRYVPAEKLPEILEGLALAGLALSFGAFMLWRIKRFLDKDEAAG